MTFCRAMKTAQKTHKRAKATLYKTCGQAYQSYQQVYPQQLWATLALPD